MSPAWTRFDFVDGPGVVKWLETKRGFVPGQIGPALARRVCEWRGGSQASIWVLDQLLTKLDLHLMDVPDTLWEERRKNARGLHVRADIRKAALRAVKEGYTHTEAARMYGISTRSIRKWTAA